MTSAVMAHLAVIGHDTRRVIVRRGKLLGPRPFGKNAEEAGEVLGNLPGVFTTHIAAEAGTPEPARLFDKVVVCGQSIHPKTSRPAARRSVLLASGLGFPPMTLDLSDLHLWASPSQGSPVKAASVRHLVRRNRELVALAGADH